MATFEQWVKEANIRELRAKLIELNQFYLEFEGFLKKELGAVTYSDLCDDFAKERTARMMRDWGMTDEDVKEFTEGLDRMSGGVDDEKS